LVLDYYLNTLINKFKIMLISTTIDNITPASGFEHVNDATLIRFYIFWRLRFLKFYSHLRRLLTVTMVCEIKTSPRNTHKKTHEGSIWTPTTVENEAKIEKNIIKTPTNAGNIQKPISFIFSFFTIVYHLYYLIIFRN